MVEESNRVSQKENNMIGIYTGCDDCKKYKCCKNSGEFTKGKGYDSEAWLLPQEAEAIRNKIEDKEIDFYRAPVNGELFGRMKRNENGRCYFLGEDGCTISDVKSFDCKMYPYDILHMSSSYFLIRYTTLCEEAIWRDKKEDLDEIVKFALPYILEYGLEVDEIPDVEFEVVRKIQI